MASRSMGHVAFPGQVALTNWLVLYLGDYSWPLPSLLWLPGLWPNLPLIISICITDREPTLCDRARRGRACINTTIPLHPPHKNMKLEKAWGRSEVTKRFLAVIVNNPQVNSTETETGRDQIRNQKAFFFLVSIFSSKKLNPLHSLSRHWVCGWYLGVKAQRTDWDFLSRFIHWQASWFLVTRNRVLF